MYGCESWTVKKAERLRIDAFELWCWRRLLRVLWTARRSNQSILKEISPGVHWKDWCWSWNSNTLPPHAKNWLIGKDSDAGRDWGQEEKGTTEDEMAGWYHRLNGHEFEWTPGVGDGLGGLVCCDSWGRKELDTTEQRNWTELSLHWLREDLCCWSLSLHRKCAGPPALRHVQPRQSDSWGKKSTVGNTYPWFDNLIPTVPCSV